MVVARAWELGKGDEVFTKYWVFVMKDEYILGICCTSKCLVKILYTSKYVNWVDLKEDFTTVWKKNLLEYKPRITWFLTKIYSQWQDVIKRKQLPSWAFCPLPMLGNPDAMETPWAMARSNDPSQKDSGGWNLMISTELSQQVVFWSMLKLQPATPSTYQLKSLGRYPSQKTAKNLTDSGPHTLWGKHLSC